MRAPDRDRCRSALAALCLASLLIATPVAALSAMYEVLPNGSAYMATVEINGRDRFEFTETGPLGEQVPIRVTRVTLEGPCTPCTFNWTRETAISFAKGNYTLRFQGPVRDNHLLVLLPETYTIRFRLPEGLDLRNPLLGMVSGGGGIHSLEDRRIEVVWNSSRTAEARFYDPGRESLLYLFGNFWIVLAVVLLLPFLLSVRRKSK